MKMQFGRNLPSQLWTQPFSVSHHIHINPVILVSRFEHLVELSHVALAAVNVLAIGIGVILPCLQ